MKWFVSWAIGSAILAVVISVILHAFNITERTIEVAVGVIDFVFYPSVLILLYFGQKRSGNPS